MPNPTNSVLRTAKASPRRSTARKGCIVARSPRSSDAPDSSYSPNLGSTIRAVTYQPIAVMTNVLAIMKYQLTAGWTSYTGSMMRAASSVMPASSGSTVPINRLAE